MPRRFRGPIPTYERSTPSLPRPVSNYVALGAQGGVGAAIAGAVGDFGQALIESAQKDRETAQAAYLARVKLNVDGALGRVAADHPDDIGSFQQRATKMRAEWLKQFPEERRKAMALYFDQAAGAHADEIYTATQDRHRKENDASLLTMQGESLKRAQAAARDGKMDRAALEMVTFDQARQARMRAGTITPEQFVTAMEDASYDVTLSKAMGGYERARTEGMDAAHNFILGLRENKDLPADVRDKVLAEVQKTFNSDMADDVNANDRREKAEEAALSDLHEKNFANVMGRILTDDPNQKLTRKELDYMRDNRRISSGDYVTALRSLEADPPTRDDPGAVVQLYEALDAGEPVKAKALSLYGDGLLTKATLDSFRNEEEQRGAASPADKQYARFVRDMVGGVKGPLAILDADSSARTAEAEREYWERVRAGELNRDVADDVVGRYRLQGLSIGALPNPRFLEGRRDDLQALEAARQATAKAFQDGRLTRETARTEAELILRLMEEAKSRQQEAVQPKGKRK